MNNKAERHKVQKITKKDFKDHLITGRQKWWKKIIEWIITILGWAILLSFVFYTIYGFLAERYGWYLPQYYVYNSQMRAELKIYIFIAFIALLICILVLLCWKEYNYLRFGRKNRRRFRKPVSNEELKEMFELDSMTLNHMQNDRYILLEKNIIPEHLGIGNKREQRKAEKKADKRKAKEAGKAK